MKLERQSGIELLRIISACLVVFGHIVSRVLESSQLYSEANIVLANIVSAISVCGVNVFILITGYFLSRNNSRVVGKPLYLILMMVCFSVGLYVMKCVAIGPGNVAFSWSIVFPTSYFVTLYSVLYLISPYINICLDRLNKSSRHTFIILSLIVFSFYLSLIDIIEEFSGCKIPELSPIGKYGRQWGYNIVNFVLLYCLGAYLNKGDFIRKPTLFWGIIFIISTLCIGTWHVLASRLECYNSSAHSYHNPIVILSAILLFMVFKDIPLQSRLVNQLAKDAFVVYIFHLMVLHFLRIDYFAHQSFLVFLLYLIVVVSLVYITSWFCWKIFDVATKGLFKRLNKIQIPYNL